MYNGPQRDITLNLRQKSIQNRYVLFQPKLLTVHAVFARQDTFVEREQMT